MEAVNTRCTWLPESIIIEILSRLPVKSLMRFKSVCKSWCRLLRHKFFVAKHHHYQTLYSKSTVLVKHPTAAGKYCLSVLCSSGDEMPTVVDTIFPPFFDTTFTYIFGHINGLFCVYDDMDSVVLYNPATREFKRIPFPTIKPLPGYIEAFTSHLGFGFDKKTNDYKIIRFIFHDINVSDGFVIRSGKEQAELYSLKNDSWRELPSLDLDVITSMNSLFNPYMNGITYWFAEARQTKNPPVVLSFDFADEVFEKLPLPFGFSSNDLDYSQLAIRNGLLSVVNYNYHESNEAPETHLETWVDIWTMMEHGVKESWKKTEVIGPIPGNPTPIGFCKKYLFCDDEKGQLVSYDRSNKQVFNFQLHDHTRTTMDLVHYVESLVPINAFTKVMGHEYRDEATTELGNRHAKRLRVERNLLELERDRNADLRHEFDEYKIETDNQMTLMKQQLREEMTSLRNSGTGE